MADTKISALTDGSPAQGTDILPVARAGTNRRLTLSDISTFTNTSLSKTVAQMQALVAGSDLIPGQTYLITDAAAAQGTCALSIKAYSTTRLENTGFGTFENAAMAAAVLAEMDYDLANDILTRVTTVYDDANTALPVTVIDKGNGAIAAFPFDQTVNFQNCYLVDPIILNITGQMFSVTLGDSCSIDLLSGGVMANIFAGSSNGFTLANSAYLSQLNIGSANNFVLPDGQQIKKYLIGDSWELDLTAFAGTTVFENGQCIGDSSTFYATAADMNDPTDLNEVAGVLDLSGYAFCGVVFINEKDTGLINTITNSAGALPSHLIRFESAVQVSPVTFKSGVDNLVLAGGLDVTLDSTSDDFLEVRLSDLDPLNFKQINSETF